MDQNRILTIGITQKTLRAGSLLDPPNFNEFDAVIWNPANTIAELSSQHFHVTSVQAVQKNIAELVEWVSHGHSLVVIASLLKPFAYVIGANRHSIDLYQHEPFTGIAFEHATGKLIDFCGPPGTQGLLDTTQPGLHYLAILKSTILVPLLKVSKSRHGNDQVVGGWKHIGKGFAIFTPPISNQPDQLLLTHYTKLAMVADHLTASPPHELPSWAASYTTDTEKVAAEHIKELEAQTNKLRLHIAEQQTVVDLEQSLKQLFVSTGDALANAVSTVLSELGLKTVEGPRGRADLIGYDGKRVAAFEVKGLEGSARENNLRQTERWVADIRSALTATAEQKDADKDLGLYANKLNELGVPDGLDVECKGVMIIGTHRKLQLAERTEPSFPDPVARPINRSHVCALSGLQLLGLLLHTRKGLANKSDILELLLSTNGVLA